MRIRANEKKKINVQDIFQDVDKMKQQTNNISQQHNQKYQINDNDYADGNSHSSTSISSTSSSTRPSSVFMIDSSTASNQAAIKLQNNKSPSPQFYKNNRKESITATHFLPPTLSFSTNLTRFQSQPNLASLDGTMQFSQSNNQQPKHSRIEVLKSQSKIIGQKFRSLFTGKLNNNRNFYIPNNNTFPPETTLESGGRSRTVSINSTSSNFNYDDDSENNRFVEDQDDPHWLVSSLELERCSSTSSSAAPSHFFYRPTITNQKIEADYNITGNKK